MSLLCRLQFHHWKAILRPPHKLPDGCVAFEIIGHRCRRCGRKVAI